MGRSKQRKTPISAFSRSRTPTQVADLGDGDAAGLDGEDDLLGLAGVVVVEVEAAVDAAVGALLLVGGARAHLAQRPPLELVFVFGGERRCACVVGRFAYDFVGGFDFGAEGVGEALLDEADGEVGNVDADPAAVEALGYLNGGAAAAEGVEDEVAFVGAGFDDAFEEGFGFLGGVAEALLGLGVDGRNVVPNCLSRLSPASRQGSACIACASRLRVDQVGPRRARFCILSLVQRHTFGDSFPFVGEVRPISVRISAVAQRVMSARFFLDVSSNGSEGNPRRMSLILMIPVVICPFAEGQESRHESMANRLKAWPFAVVRFQMISLRKNCGPNTASIRIFR